MDPKQKALQKLIETVHRLRAPGGCPWDREQTHQSLRPFLIEESYEVLEVLDQIDSPQKLKDPKTRDALKEELGDLLMQIVLHAEITRESGAFDFYDVAQTLDEKLIRRHPHVFGEVKVESSEQVVKNWDEIKKKEKQSDQPKLLLDSIPKNQPALPRAQKVIEKVTKVGFQWPDVQGPLEKVEEELSELKEAIESKDPLKIKEELGDLLFCICNVAHMTKIDPEESLRLFLKKFETRFNYIENKINESGRTLKESNLAEMDKLWEESKK